MRREQRKQERDRIKTIDMDIVRAAIALSLLVADRSKIDPLGTKGLTAGIIETLQRVGIVPGKEEV